MPLWDGSPHRLLWRGLTPSPQTTRTPASMSRQCGATGFNSRRRGNERMLNAMRSGARYRKMSLPGFEPGLSRPRRDVLTTRRQGRPKRRWADCCHARGRAVRELLTRTASAKDPTQPAIQLPRVRCDQPSNTMKPVVVSLGAALVTARCAVRPLTPSPHAMSFGSPCGTTLPS